MPTLVIASNIEWSMLVLSIAMTSPLLSASGFSIKASWVALEVNLMSEGDAFVGNYTPRVLSPQMYDMPVIPKSRSENFRFPTYSISYTIGE